MRQRINVRYRNAAEEFARRALDSLGMQIHSIVLYGSVARGRARRDSDTDILIVGTKPDLRDQIFDVAYEVGEATGFQAYLSVAHFSRREFRELVQLGSPFIANVLEDGVVLYDDGTFSRIRRKAAAAIG